MICPTFWLHPGGFGHRKSGRANTLAFPKHTKKNSDSVNIKSSFIMFKFFLSTNGASVGTCILLVGITHVHTLRPRVKQKNVPLHNQPQWPTVDKKQHIKRNQRQYGDFGNNSRTDKKKSPYLNTPPAACSATAQLTPGGRHEKIIKLEKGFSSTMPPCR